MSPISPYVSSAPPGDQRSPIELSLMNLEKQVDSLEQQINNLGVRLTSIMLHVPTLDSKGSSDVRETKSDLEQRLDGYTDRLALINNNLSYLLSNIRL